jgi:hypothetical protein
MGRSYGLSRVPCRAERQLPVSWPSQPASGVATSIPHRSHARQEAGLRYDVSMAQSNRFAFALLLACLFLGLGGCKMKQKPKPLLLHVLTNLSSPYGHELDHRIIEFQTSNPRTASGRPIVVRPVEIGDYKDMLQNHIGRDISVEMVILDAPEDAALNSHIMADMGRAVNVCAAVKACPANVPALIPSGTEGEDLEAAQIFQQALEKAAPS